MESYAKIICVEFIKLCLKNDGKNLDYNTHKVRGRNPIRISTISLVVVKRPAKLFLDIFHWYCVVKFNWFWHTHILPKGTLTDVYNTICIFRSHGLHLNTSFLCRRIVFTEMLFRNLANVVNVTHKCKCVNIEIEF